MLGYTPVQITLLCDSERLAQVIGLNRPTATVAKLDEVRLAHGENVNSDASVVVW